MTTMKPKLFALLREKLTAMRGSSPAGGILRMSLVPPKEADGIATTPVLNQQDWRDLYSGLAKGASSSAGVPSLDEIDHRVNVCRTDGAVPIGMACYNYESLKPESLVHFLKSAKSEDVSGSLDSTFSNDAFEAKSSFFATAFLENSFHYFHPQVPPHFGLTARFVLPSDLCLSNVGSPLNNFVVDFDDGKGPRPVRLDEAVEVKFAGPGAKSFQLTATIGGEIRRAKFEINVIATTAPPADQMLMLESTYQFQGLKALGHAWVYYGNDNGIKHTGIVNPLIFSEGFPGGYSLDYLWWSLNDNSCGLLQGCLDGGRDVVLLGYEDGTTYVEANAGVVIDCIQKIIADRQGNAPLIVGGACMGGVVTRYALAYMESNVIDHQTSMFFSVDSPHMGINVPASIQYFMGFFEEFMSQKMKDYYKKLMSIAGQELMLYTTSSYDVPPDAPSTLRATFINNLNSIGNFPKQPLKIGSSNGVDTGIGNNTPPGVCAVQGSLFDFFVYLYSAPGDTQDPDYQYLLFSWADVADSYWPNCPASFDSAPGSIETFFGQIAEALGVTSPPYPDCAFVPVLSSLALSGMSPYVNTDLFWDLAYMPRFSELDHYYCDSQNNPHMKVTPELAAWYLSWFTPALAKQLAEAS